jgi:hypothetical protein
MDLREDPILGRDLNRPPRRLRNILAAALLCAACRGTDPAPTPTTLDRLQGTWRGAKSTQEGEFLRTDAATMEVQHYSLKYALDSEWKCHPPGAPEDPPPYCAEEPPHGHGTYYEGLFGIAGDSLKGPDLADTVLFRNLSDSTLDLIVNGVTVPMTSTR